MSSACPTCGAAGAVPELDARERWEVCLHEAGHAVVALVSGARVTHASVGREGTLAGATMVEPQGVPPRSWRAVWAAGMAAELVELGGIRYTRASDDLLKIRASALSQGHEVGNAVEAAIRDAERILRPRSFAVFAFAHRLHQAGSLSAAEIATMARQLRLRPGTGSAEAPRVIQAPRPARFGHGLYAPEFVA